MKNLASIVLACSVAVGGLTFMGCHASGSVDTEDTTPHDTKTVTTMSPNGEKTTHTETHTYPNQNPDPNP